MKRLFFLLYAVFTAASACAQAQLLNVSHGLSNKDITAIIQGRHGGMWIGTSNGVNYYDGYTFREYNRHNGLSNGRIKCLYEDSSGRLWIGTWEGLNILDLSSGTVKKYFQSREDGGGRNTSSQVGNIVPHTDGSVLVTLGDGNLVRFTRADRHETVFRLYDHDNIYAYSVAAVASLPDSSICLVNTYSGVTKLDKYFRIDSQFVSPLKHPVTVFSRENDTHLYFVDAPGNICKADGKSGQALKMIEAVAPKAESHVLSAHSVTGANEIWLSYSDGIVEKIDPVTSVRTNYTAEIMSVLNGASVVICRDRRGLAWVGTDYGLIKFIPRNHFFRTWLAPKGTLYKNKNSIRGMTEDSGGVIFIGGYNGLFSIDPRTGAERHFEFPELGTASSNAYYPFRLINDGDHVWITSETRGFYRFNKKTGKLDFMVREQTSGRDGFYKALAMAEQGRDTLWIGTHNGLYVYSRKRNIITKYKCPPGTMDIDKLEISDLVVGHDSRLYLGGYTSGAFILDIKRGVTHRYSVYDNSLPHNFVTVVYPEYDSILWVGSRGGGLARINTVSSVSRIFLKHDGLADNSIAGILKDRSGRLWISTFNGLSRYDPVSRTFANFYEKDGLTDNEFNIAAHLKTRDGVFYFGGVNGINSFRPEELTRQSAHRPAIFLTRFVKYDGEKEALTEKYVSGEAGTVQINPGDKFFSFTFALDDYYNSSHNVFSYKLEGFDAEWNNIGTQNTVRFNTLPGGNYVLKVRATSAEGMPSINELTIPVTVSAAFYRTWWFALIVAAALILVVYLIIAVRVRQKLKIAQLRTKISSDLHDEVGSLLTRISVRAELLKQEMNETRGVAELDAIANASRQATSAMSDVLWSIDARNDNVQNLVDKLREHAGEVLHPLDITVTLRLESMNEAAGLDNELRQELFLIFKEAINNVARHASATEVEIFMGNRNGVFEMEVRDNGTGAGNGARQTGQGLRNMRMRAEKLKGRLDVETDNGFAVRLSMQKFN